jgi:hypothetical protein
MDVLVGALIALASALLGALTSARFQRTAEYRAWKVAVALLRGVR